MIGECTMLGELESGLCLFRTDWAEHWADFRPRVGVVVPLSPAGSLMMGPAAAPCELDLHQGAFPTASPDGTGLDAALAGWPQEGKAFSSCMVWCCAAFNPMLRSLMQSY